MKVIFFSGFPTGVILAHNEKTEEFASYQLIWITMT